MSPKGHSRYGQERGFTLTELVVVIAILGLITFVLTEAVILGLKTTDSTARELSRYVDVQALHSYFTGDAQSADEVSTAATACATADPGVFLNLIRTDQGVVRTVAYSLDPPDSGEQDLVRWSCTAAATERRLVGHFSRKIAEPVPVIASCGDAAGVIAACGGAPATITLTIQPDPASPPNVLTVTRRAP